MVGSRTPVLRLDSVWFCSLTGHNADITPLTIQLGPTLRFRQSRGPTPAGLQTPVHAHLLDWMRCLYRDGLATNHQFTLVNLAGYRVPRGTHTRRRSLRLRHL